MLCETLHYKIFIRTHKNSEPNILGSLAKHKFPCEYLEPVMQDPIGHRVFQNICTGPEA